jgi:hypothetical protein
MEVLKTFLLANPSIKLLVIDTLPKFLRLLDSDKYDGAVLAMERLEKLSHYFRIQIVCVAHAKKRGGDEAGDALMGSTAHRAASDTNIFLTSKPETRRSARRALTYSGLHPSPDWRDSLAGFESQPAPILCNRSRTAG